MLLLIHFVTMITIHVNWMYVTYGIPLLIVWSGVAALYDIHFGYLRKRYGK